MNKEQTKKEKKQINKKLKEIWAKLSYKLNSQTWTPYADQILKFSMEESKRHDNIRSNHIKRGITIKEEAVYFCLKWLVGCSYNYEKLPELKDYLHVTKTYFMGACLSVEYNDLIKSVVSSEDALFINGLDYCELIEEGV